jgi:tetratricopeptide (TPR) repeat protein
VVTAEIGILKKYYFLRPLIFKLKKNSMLRKIALTLGLFVCTQVAFSQSKIIVEAETYYRSEKYFEGAEKCSLAYTKLNRKGNLAKKQKADMAFKTAECYRMTERYREANEWYDRAILLDYQDVNPEVFFYNGEMLHMIGEFEKAVKNYEAYKKLVPSDPRTDTALRASNDNKDFIANKTRHVVENQTAINKKELDMAPMFADRKETKLYFASSRTGGTGNDRTLVQVKAIWIFGSLRSTKRVTGVSRH